MVRAERIRGVSIKVVTHEKKKKKRKAPKLRFMIHSRTLRAASHGDHRLFLKKKTGT